MPGKAQSPLTKRGRDTEWTILSVFVVSQDVSADRGHAAKFGMAGGRPRNGMKVPIGEDFRERYQRSSSLGRGANRTPSKKSGYGSGFRHNLLQSEGQKPVHQLLFKGPPLPTPAQIRLKLRDKSPRIRGLSCHSVAGSGHPEHSSPPFPGSARKFRVSHKCSIYRASNTRRTSLLTAAATASGTGTREKYGGVEAHRILKSLTC